MGCGASTAGNVAATAQKVEEGMQLAGVAASTAVTVAAAVVTQAAAVVATAAPDDSVEILGIVKTPFGEAKVPKIILDHSHDPLLATIQSWISRKLLGPDGTLKLGGVTLRQRDVDEVAHMLSEQLSGTQKTRGFLTTMEAHLQSLSDRWDAFKQEHKDGKLNLALDYAKMLLYIGLAKLVGRKDAEDDIKDQLVQYSEIDPGWLKPLLEQLKHPGQTAYRPHSALTDYVYPIAAKATREDTSGPLRIALISDWGTGQEQARDMVEKINKMGPDMLIHLGDVYYSGTYDEEHDYFYSICTRALPDVALYNMPGNHDYYAGGEGYLAVVDELRESGVSKQESSYFALEGEHWMIIAMDTAYHDADPLQTFTGSNMTKLPASEVEWHKDKVAKAKAAGKKIIALSHHQWCTLCSNVGERDGKAYALNLNLQDQIGSIVPEFSAWFWGHEHSMQMFQPYAGLQRGRLIGNGSTPILQSMNPYKPNDNLVPPSGEALPGVLPLKMGDAAFGYYHNNGFAMLTLDGAKAKVDYYDIPWLYSDIMKGNKWGEPRLIHSEEL